MRMIAIALLLGLVACGKSADLRYTCDLSAVAGLYTCTHFGPMDAGGVNYNRSYCASWGGTFGLEVTCPTAGVVASCSMPASAGGTDQYWYSGATGIADIERQCTMNGGHWTTVP